MTGVLWSGGLTAARRAVGVLALASLAPVPLGAAGQQGAASPVCVTERDGLYTVTARFEVRQPPELVQAVLTDYEQIPRFMTGVATSVVRQRGPGHAVVEQEAVSRMWMFSKRIHLRLEVDEASHAIRFRDVSGRSFTRYEGAWKLAPAGDATGVTYELSAKPSFSVPDFVLKKLLRRDAAAMIEGLQAEMALRGQLPSPPQRAQNAWPMLK